MNEWRHTIINLYTNKRGKYQKGWDKGKHPEDVLTARNIQWNGDRSAKCYKKAQQELYRFCADLLRDGYITGGVGSCPTRYIIASNEKEIRMVFCNRKNQMIGRIRNMMLKGRTLIKLDAPKKLIEELISVKEMSSEEGLDEEDYSQEAWDLNIEDAKRMRELESEREKIRRGV